MDSKWSPGKLRLPRNRVLQNCPWQLQLRCLRNVKTTYSCQTIGNSGWNCYCRLLSKFTRSCFRDRLNSNCRWRSKPVLATDVANRRYLTCKYFTNFLVSRFFSRAWQNPSLRVDSRPQVKTVRPNGDNFLETFFIFVSTCMILYRNTFPHTQSFYVSIFN